MKVTTDYGILGLSGSREGTILYYHPRLQATLMRSKPKMPHQLINDTYREIARQRKKIQPSEAYKKNFRFYTSQLTDEVPTLKVASWYNLYVKMLWTMQAKYPDTVNLLTLTREQIYEQDLPCKTLKMAVEAGLLPEVKGYDSFTAEI
jgi:hypothetical protein